MFHGIEKNLQTTKFRGGEGFALRIRTVRGCIHIRFYDVCMIYVNMQVDTDEDICRFMYRSLGSLIRSDAGREEAVRVPVAGYFLPWDASIRNRPPPLFPCNSP